ncbi:MAG: type I-E CRISPR-associated protein Cas5/CasD [Elusimicrobia bacterium GWC2_51_8]|nr:MAG: type I-E CRISPR-associated protein Cas5/CasD [Elusimicrobia bacterium GWA2_51_34]OGR59548.1 MAG: type I-E CRISPR-associated protein Cas5/CasD [Elusimicrobia bacterium GWC2_51_8]HAF94473.1 type I-E CRISPR-associated protein Cas5/CasD [Elusimicrobiota bacterium]HCE98970.1 type I-E CRISPR-associated protein Cas5/CasD [Elusimicrobiota bacterium]
MTTLLLKLAGPMQSWGTTSRFDQRDTGKEPSKSGVIGLLAAAMGIDQENWTELEPLTCLSMGVRHDRPGVPKYDYQTAQHIISADRAKIHETAVTKRDYIADAAFLVGFEGGDSGLLLRLNAALRNPVWPPALGRKSYVPSEPVWIENGVQNAPLKDVLMGWPWITSERKWEKRPEKLLFSFESADGSGVLKMDQPLSSFAERRFGARFVRSEWIPFPQEASNVSA